MFHDPINRWYVSRWIYSTTVEDFTQAVHGVNEALEHMTGDKFDLKVAFYKAAAGDTMHDKPRELIKEVTKLEDVYARQYRKSDYVEATLTVRPRCGDAPEGRPHFDQVKISAKWPDPRRIDFEASPAKDALSLCHMVNDSRFTFWTKGVEIP